MKPGMLELLSFLEEHQTLKVVASSNQRAVIEFLFKKNNPLERFGMIISAEDVQRVKPDPEIFLLVDQKLGTAKRETLILEDLQSSILTVPAAEIPVVIVPDLLPSSQELIRKTVGVISSLHEIPASIK